MLMAHDHALFKCFKNKSEAQKPVIGWRYVIFTYLHIFSQVARYVAHVLTGVEPQSCFDSYVLLLDIIMKVPRSWQLSKVFSL